MLNAARNLLNRGYQPGYLNVPASRVEDLVSVATLYRGTGLMETPLHSLYRSRGNPEPAAAQVAFEGAIAAYRLDPATVEVEAQWILERLDTEFWIREGEWSLTRFLPRVPLYPDWSLAVFAGLSQPLLEQALQHPVEGITWTAEELLSALSS
jgi:hypothetical protein